MSPLNHHLHIDMATPNYMLANCYNADAETTVSSVTGAAVDDLGDEIVISDCEPPLIGRDEQSKALREGYARIKMGRISEFMLVYGPSGVGKTSLVETLRTPVMVGGGGYFCCAKFENLSQTQVSNDPFSEISAALLDLCDLVEQEAMEGNADESDDTPPVVRKVSPAAGLAAVASFRRYVQEQYVENRTHIRFRFVCRDFLRAVSSSIRPIVFFMDNLQWAQKESQEIVKALVSDRESKSVLLVGAYRDDGKIAEIRQLQRSLMIASILPTTNLKLENLSLDLVQEFLVETLQLDSPSSMRIPPFAELLMSRTGGNPFCLVQYLNHLKDEKLLIKQTSGDYDWDLGAIRQATNASDNILTLLELRLGNLTAECQSVLVYAAYLGPQFERELLEAALDRADSKKVVDRCLRWASEYGLVEKVGKTSNTVVFTHDRIQQILCTFVKEGPIRQKTHLRIGLRLKKHRNLPANQTGTLSKAFFFAAIEHLNIAADLIDDPKDRSELIEMNLEAARHCIANGAFSAVELHVKKGIELIQEPWQDEWFTTTLELSKLHAKCLYCTGRFEESIVIAESIVQNATIKSDKAVAFQIIVDSLQATGALDEAFTRGIAFLREMDDVFPVRPSAFHVVRGMAALRRYLHKFADDNLSRTVVCQDEYLYARQRLLLSVGYLCTVTNREKLLALLTLRVVEQSALFGFTPCTAVAFAMCGVLHVAMGKREEARRFGTLAFKLLEHHNWQEVRSRIITLNSYVIPWQEQFEQLSHNPFEEAIRDQLDSGDINFAFLTASVYLVDQIAMGLPFSELEVEAANLSDWAKHFHDPLEAMAVCTIWQFSVNMMDDADNPMILTGDATVEDVLLREAQKKQQYCDAGLDTFAEISVTISQRRIRTSSYSASRSASI